MWWNVLVWYRMTSVLQNVVVHCGMLHVMRWCNMPLWNVVVQHKMCWCDLKPGGVMWNIVIWNVEWDVVQCGMLCDEMWCGMLMQLWLCRMACNAECDVQHLWCVIVWCWMWLDAAGHGAELCNVEWSYVVWCEMRCGMLWWDVVRIECSCDMQYGVMRNQL